MTPPELETPEDRLSEAVRETNHSAIYLLRTTQQHHVQLSAMADQKASIIIGAAFVVLALAFGKASGGEQLPIALLILVIAMAMSALLAAWAVMPRFAKSPRHGANMLFFGHFTAISEAEYVKQIHEVLASETSVHEAMARDIHQQGMVLRFRKFRFLAWSYRVLIVGAILASLCYLAHFFHLI
jgi:hypothetical protein